MISSSDVVRVSRLYRRALRLERRAATLEFTAQDLRYQAEEIEGRGAHSPQEVTA